MDKNDKKFIPARLTITDDKGIFQPVGAKSNENLAVRPGYIYTGNGKASFGLRAGTYTIYASRGFEYGFDSVHLVVRPGDRVNRHLTISREVITDGWISSDPHIHTATYSGHGDATTSERILTIAGEGIELPVITDHNIKVDIDSLATNMKLRSHFTPIVGYEYTTAVGHFNVFPSVGGSVPDHRVANWESISNKLHNTDSGNMIVLNHARDLHSNFRPFDPQRHIAIAGMDLKGWKLPANAMEVINSGALQTDWMRLYKDWFGMINKGHFLTPIGASDSHDVGRYLLGQARTYIKSTDQAGEIDVDNVLKSLRQGEVSVSFGLLTEMLVHDRFGPGDVVKDSSDHLCVSVRVLGPSWTQASQVALFANGEKIREEIIPKGINPGEKWNGTWRIAWPKQDLFLVAIATAPGPRIPFWQIAKPYQPSSPEWEPYVIGSTSVIWIDAEGDGEWTSANSYARKIIKESNGNYHTLIQKLKFYDTAVAIQVAALLQENGLDLSSYDISNALMQASNTTKLGFQKFIQSYQMSLHGQ